MQDYKTIYTTEFEDYKNLGLDPVVIPYEDGHPTKGPKIQGWQIKAGNGQNTAEDFNDQTNIGNLLGGPKNLTDIDCDSRESFLIGREIMDDLMRKTGQTMVFGRYSKPHSHYVFSCDRSLPIEQIRDPSDHKSIVEYRCLNKDGERGQQSVFPPSQRWDPVEEVETVRFEEGSSSCKAPVPVEATKLYQAFRLIGATALLSKHFPAESERHTTILALAGTLARAGMPHQQAAQIVTLAYRYSIGYNNDDEKAEADVKAVYAAYSGDSETHLFGYPMLTEIIPKTVVDKALDLLGIPRPKDLKQPAYHLTDAGNGRRLVDKHRDEVRYCVDDRQWYLWDGVRWRKDSANGIRELAKAIADDIRSEANIKQEALPDETETDNLETRKRELLKWANQSESADRVSKTIISAQSDPAIICHRSDFDQHGHLLNCLNGVVNLYTGEMLAHDRTLMMSNLCPTEYDPNAAHPVWEQSLAAFTRNHPDLLPFLKRVAGYSVQGNKTEERILILYGLGNAGKGTFMDWLTSALGPDYACAMDATSVLKQNRDSAAASGDIARLEGKRIVVVSEIEKGSRVQESFMKQASGNDAIVARGLYKAECEFRPTHQFWFQSNYRPAFDSTDSGNRRRYVEIPFDNDLSADPLVRFNSKLKIQMRQDPAFRKAVLNWCVQGSVEWRQDGLGIPESVKAATAELFAHNDFLKDFLSEMCIQDPKGRITVKDLTTAYNRYCEDQGEQPAQGRTFNKMMEERGYERKQGRVNGFNGKAWFGIRLIRSDDRQKSKDTLNNVGLFGEEKV